MLFWESLTIKLFSRFGMTLCWIIIADVNSCQMLSSTQHCNWLRGSQFNTCGYLNLLHRITFYQLIKYDVKTTYEIYKVTNSYHIRGVSS